MFVPLKNYLIVDGYNIIYAWNDLRELSNVSLESARVKLIDKLSNYQGFTDEVVIVVFDGYKVSGSKGTLETHNKVFVVYTKEAETADNYIERAVTKLPKEYYIRVATNDALEQTIILGKGATRITANELSEMIQVEEKKIRRNYTEKRPVKNNPLIDNVNKETLEWLEMMRRKRK